MSEISRRRGRPRLFTFGKREEAKRLYISGSPISQIVEQLDISRATFYRYQEEWKVPYLELGIVDFFKAPIEYYNRFPAGNHPGHFDIQIVKLIAQDLKMRVRFKPVPLHGLFSGIDDGAFSVGIGNIGNSEGRRRLYGMSEPYSNFSGKPMGALVARRSSHRSSFDLESLEGKKVATSSMSLSHEWLLKRNKARVFQVVPLGYPSDLLKVLHAGQVDAVMDSHAFLTPLLAKFPQFEVKGPIIDFGNTTICLVHDKCDERMLNLISESIVRLRRLYLLEALEERILHAKPK